MKLSNLEVAEIIDRLEEMHPEASCALDHRNNFELLIAVVLSAQTTDVSVNKVTPALFEKYTDAGALSNAEPEDVENIIRTIGLYKNKARNIVNLAKVLEEKYNGEVPGDFDELVKLPGVGRKTANVVLAEAFGEQRIAVDTHVHRVSNRIGLAHNETPEKTEKELMGILPQDKWTRAHHLLIFHGRKCCNARVPKCDECLLTNLCSYYINKGK